MKNTFIQNNCTVYLYVFTSKKMYMYKYFWFIFAQKSGNKIDN